MNEEVLLQLDGISMHYGKGETAVTALAGAAYSGLCFKTSTSP